MNPYFSIVIPLFNKETHIKTTIESALKQSFSDFEIIIVNDGSTDDSLKIAKSIDDLRLTIFSTENKGVSHARNYGVSKAKSEFIALLDADDLWEINHLENLHKLINNYPGCGLYATAYTKKLNNTYLRSKFNGIPTSLNWSGVLDNYFKSSIYNTIAWTSAVAIPKKVLLETNGFDESITLGAGEDTDLWIRIALNYPVAFSNIATAVHNLHAFNRLSNSNTNKRTFLNLDKYEEEANKRPYLKKYLDRNRFSIGLQYKLSGNSNQSKDFFKKIAKKNLNWKQKILLSSPMFLLKAYISIQRFLRKIGVQLTPFH